MHRPLWLIGMMGSGKTTVAPMVAAALDVEWADTDRVIEEMAGLSIDSLFAKSEAAFRVLEIDVIQSLAAGPCVVATGGGAVTTAAADTIAESGFVVWLRATPETLMSRVGDGLGRPLLAQGPDAVARIASDRAPSYARVADAVVDTDDLGPEEVARRVVMEWQTASSQE